MLTNEIQKGTEVLLRNGFQAVVMDNQKRQATRLCKVYGAAHGMYDEVGSVYSSDIVQAKVDGAWVKVSMSAKQAESAAMRRAMGF